MLKVMCKNTLTKAKCETNVLKELKIHQKCSHPNIVGFYGFFYDETSIYYILEYCPNGNLYSLIKKMPLNEAKAATV